MLRIRLILAGAIGLAAASPVQAVFRDCVMSTGFEDSGTTDPQAADALALHNCARRSVVPAAATPIPPLTWSGDLATFAQTWSAACVWKHSQVGYGENIYAAAGSVPTLKAATTSWLNEQPYYNYAANTCSAPSPPGTCGHYTQAVWDTTTQLGCGMSYCTQNSPFGSSFPNWYFVVCDYLPAGNDGGRPY